MFVIFSDSDCDITPSLCKEYGINSISMPYSINDKEYYPYVDYDENSFDYKKHYDLLREGVLPKTSGLSPEKYIEHFEPFLKNGNDILYVHFSKAMSGTFNAFNLAVETLQEKYPNNKIYTIDTKGISVLSHIIVNQVVKLYKEGKSIDEIMLWAKENVDKFNIYFYADNLKFFKLSGRVSGISATMGTILGIHPIIHVSKNGVMETLSKCRGKKATLQKIVQFVEENQEDIEKYPVYIGHSDALEIAHQLGDLLQAKFGKLDIRYNVVNPTIGSHCGPDCAGVTFHSKGRK